MKKEWIIRKNDDCDKCIHGFICKYKEEYSRYIEELKGVRENHDSSLFAHSTYCRHFECE